MKYFKKEATRSSERYIITAENFEKVTDHKSPYEIRNTDGSISQYGVCPSCLNPIQIIGLVKKSKNSPYGRHAGKTIRGIASWNQLKYEYCPYADKRYRRRINEDELLPEITEDVIELYDLLKNNFDRVVYVIEKALNIRCTSSFWTKVLEQYLINEAYCYPWLTEANLPYIFAYRGMTHNNLYGQQVKVNSPIYNKLQKHNNVRFEKSQNGKEDYRIIFNKDRYLNLEFRFTEHRQNALDGKTLIETMRFCIDDLTSGETIVNELIEFDETYFMNIVNNSSNERCRNQKLLNIAQKIMVPLC